jgi:AcrR family transcriptional regulator
VVAEKNPGLWKPEEASMTREEASMTERRPERADAARNRRAILRATEALLQRLEPEQVSVEQVAAAAGVGKGTVFHRFGSRVGLMRSLMEDRALTLHDAVTDGPPPLGPGAPPHERLIAFLEAIVDLVTRNIGLISAQEHAQATRKHDGGVREANPVYVFWHGHVAALIAEARPDLDAEVLAHILLGSLHSAALAELIREGRSGRFAACLRDLATALLGAPANAPGQTG